MKKRIFIIISLVLSILAVAYLSSSYFEINSDLLSSQNGVVVSAVEKPTSVKPSLRFVVFADSQGKDNGINADVFKTCMMSIKKLSPQPSFFVAVGDLVYGSSSSTKTRAELTNFSKTFRKYYPQNYLYPTFGNHEAQCGIKGEKAMANTFYSLRVTPLVGYNRSVYYFDRGGSRFFVLNSDHYDNIGYISEAQLKWVESNLNPKSERNFFFLHEPPYPTGPSSLFTKSDKRDQTWQVIDSAKNAMVFSGHEHFYSRRHIDASNSRKSGNINFNFNQTVYQLTVGGFGGDLRTGFGGFAGIDVAPISEHHYAVVDLCGTSVSVKVYSMSGKVLDSFKVE